MSTPEDGGGPGYGKNLSSYRIKEHNNKRDEIRLIRFWNTNRSEKTPAKDLSNLDEIKGKNR